jgi:hypothetical protein
MPLTAINGAMVNGQKRKTRRARLEQQGRVLKARGVQKKKKTLLAHLLHSYCYKLARKYNAKEAAPLKFADYSIPPKQSPKHALTELTGLCFFEKKGDGYKICRWVDF